MFKIINTIGLTFSLLIVNNIAIAEGSDSDKQQKLPNILLLVAEDMSGHVGAFGDKVAKTPNLDTLAKESILYPNSFTTAGVCAPSRAALITGVNQASIGAQHMRTRSFKKATYRAVPPVEVKAFPELLRQLGYYTYVSNKLDYQFSNTKAHTGPFTIWNYEGDKPTWHGRKSGQPFFGMYHLNITHESQGFPKTIAKNKAAGIVKDWIKAKDVEVPPYYPDTPIVRQAIAQLQNNVHAMDIEVGAILEQLEKEGLAENTIVIWTTDHGNGLPRAKREIYDAGIKVPLMVYWPKKYKPTHIKSGTIDKQLISFVDIAPSILAMAGRSVPSYIQGQPRLTLDSTPTRQYIYAAKDRLDQQSFYERAVRSDQFKYIKNFLPGKPGASRLAYREQLPIMAELWRAFESGKMTPQQSFWFMDRPSEELYDINNDPHEVNNLASDPKFSKQLTTMRNALAEWQNHAADLSTKPETVLANDFWPNSVQPVTASPKISINKSGLIVLNNQTKGASIGFKINDGDWQVYAKPINVELGSKVMAKSVRYGWQESQPVEFKR